MPQFQKNTPRSLEIMTHRDVKEMRERRSHTYMKAEGADGSVE